MNCVGSRLGGAGRQLHARDQHAAGGVAVVDAQRAATKLRASRLAPTIRMTAKAASTISRMSRRRWARAPRNPLPDDRSALLNASERSTRAPRAAGASPAASAATSVVSAQKTSTERSSATASRRGSLGGAIAGSAPHQPPREHQAERAARDREDRVLGEQLARDPRAAAADRRPDGELALAREAAREQEIGDVRARDDQHQRDGDGQDRQRRPRRSGDVVRQRAGVHDHRAALAEEELGQPVPGRGPRGRRAFGLGLGQASRRASAERPP